MTKDTSLPLEEQAVKRKNVGNRQYVLFIYQFCDFSNGRLASWDAAIRTWSIVPCDQPSHVHGKNAADITLAVDAVGLM